MGDEMSTALIVGSAPCGNLQFLNAYLQGISPLVICADGGVKHVEAAGLTPDLLIGDWDSGGAPRAQISCITLPAEKDMTDLQAAAEYALAHGVEKLLLCGCTGGRVDHTAFNLVLLEWIAARGGVGMVLDEGNEVRLMLGGTALLQNRPPYRYLSLLPLDTRISGVTLRGVKYPLENATLTRGDTFSISNEPAGEWQEISVAAGRGLIIRSERLDLLQKK